MKLINKRKIITSIATVLLTVGPASKISPTPTNHVLAQTQTQAQESGDQSTKQKEDVLSLLQSADLKGVERTSEEAEKLLQQLEEKIIQGSPIHSPGTKLSPELKGLVPDITQDQEQTLVNYLSVYKLNQVQKRAQESQNLNINYSLSDYPELSSVVDEYKKAIKGESDLADYIEPSLTKDALNGGLEYTLYDIDYNKQPELLLRRDGRLGAIYYLDKDKKVQSLPKSSNSKDGYDIVIRQDYQIFATQEINDQEGSWHLWDFNYPGDQLSVSLEYTYKALDEEKEENDESELVFTEIGNDSATYDFETVKAMFNLENENNSESVDTVDLDELNWVELKQDSGGQIQGRVSLNVTKSSGQSSRLTASSLSPSPKKENKEPTAPESSSTSQDNLKPQDELTYGVPIENIGDVTFYSPNQGINSPTSIDISSSSGTATVNFYDVGYIINEEGEEVPADNTPSVYTITMDYVPTQSIEVFVSPGSLETKTVYSNTRITLNSCLQGSVDSMVGNQYYLYYNNNGGVSMAVPNYAGNVPDGYFHVMVQYNM